MGRINDDLRRKYGDINGAFEYGVKDEHGVEQFDRGDHVHAPPSLSLSRTTLAPHRNRTVKVR
jgi:hypothetical protein